MNHRYMIALEEYTKSGAPSGKMSYVYKDNLVDFIHSVEMYKSMNQVDEEGKEISMKKYVVTPQMLTYVTITNIDEFKRVNHVGL